MPTISLVTPVGPGGEGFLAETYESIARQELPAGWAWEWVVQEDGETGRAAAMLPDDPRVSAGMGRAGRAGMARTMALGRSSGELIKAIDADDLLPPGTLWRDVTTLDEHPEIGWTACAALDLWPDGSTTGVPTDPPTGPIEPGSLFHSYEERRLAILGTTVCARRDLVLALGGWPALPSSEDVGLMLALDQVSPGWFIPEVGLLYRQHDRQSTKLSGFTADDEVSGRRAVIAERVEAIRRLGWAVKPSASAAAAARGE